MCQEESSVFIENYKTLQARELAGTLQLMPPTKGSKALKQAGIRLDPVVFSRLDVVASRQRRSRSDAARLLIETALLAFEILGGDLPDLAVRLEKRLKSRTTSDRATKGESRE